MKITGSATVILTVEIPTSGSYGEGWKLEDLHRQVVREAKQAIEGHFPRSKIIGEPKIKLCTFEVE